MHRYKTEGNKEKEEYWDKLSDKCEDMYIELRKERDSLDKESSKLSWQIIELLDGNIKELVNS